MKYTLHLLNISHSCSPFFRFSPSLLCYFFIYSVCSFYLVLRLTNFRTLNKMLVINQSCHGKNTHRFIIGLALHFYSFFFYHPPSSSLNLSAPTVQKTHRRDTHMLYSTHRQNVYDRCCSTVNVRWNHWRSHSHCTISFQQRMWADLQVLESLHSKATFTFEPANHSLTAMTEI